MKHRWRRDSEVKSLLATGSVMGDGAFIYPLTTDGCRVRDLPPGSYRVYAWKGNRELKVYRKTLDGAKRAAERFLDK